MRRHGFSLLEITIAISILSIISMLGYVMLISSTESAQLAQAKAEVQGNLRDVMGELTSALREAYTARTVNAAPPIAPEDTAAIRVSEDGQSVTFQVPVAIDDPSRVQSSAPITFLLQNEDTYESEIGFNAVLDGGEDTNGDGVLTRRIARIEGGQEVPVGVANNISACTFQLLPSEDSGNNQLTTLRIWLEASKSYGLSPPTLVRGELESRIHLAN